MLTRHIQRLLHTAAFLLDYRKDIEVFGMFGAANLGDEAMLVAAHNLLPAGRVIECKTGARLPIAHSMIRARWRSTLLVAGGTLIHGGDTEWLDFVEHRAQQGAQVVFFGTGIAFNEDQLTDSYPPYRRWRDRKSTRLNSSHQ